MVVEQTTGKRPLRFVALRIVVAVIGAVAFGVLAVNVAQGAEWLLPFDRSVQSIIFPLRNPDLTRVLETLTHLSGTKVSAGIALLFALFLFFFRSKSKGIVFVLCVGVGEAIVFAVKVLVDRSRPFGLNLIDFPNDASFPSGHTFAAIAIVAFIIFVLLKEYKEGMPIVVKVLLVIVAVLWPLAIGFTRLYLGVHWPTDVLASLIFGGLFYFPLATLAWDGLAKPRRPRGKHAR